MNLFAIGLAVAVFAPASLSAQDLPPGVLLLSRIKRHMRQELAHVSEHICMETIDRYRKPAGPKGLMHRVDTVRLEVLNSANRELFASPGDRSFSDEAPSAFIGGGMIGDGLFATHLKTLFVDDNGIFKYRGEESLGGRQAVRYDFSVSFMRSGYTIQTVAGSGIAGMKGSFWADPESLDVLRLEVHAEDIPPNVPVSDVITTVDYALVRIGADDVMLPQTGDLHMLMTSGEEARDIIEFTHCHSFQVQSSVSFDAPPPSAAPLPAGIFRPAGPPAHTEPAIPAGLMVTMLLTTPIDEQAGVGSLIGGKVVGNSNFKGKVLIPDGALVTGRLRRLERYSDSGDYFIVALEFTEIESADSRCPFYADLKDVDRTPGIEWLLTNSTSHVRYNANGPEYISTTENIRIPDLPGIGAFFVRGTRLNLPKGLKMVWKTRTLSR